MGIDLRAYHEPPEFSKEGRYTNITVCPECHLHTEGVIGYEFPCWRCGYTGEVKTAVAKWKRYHPRWKFWRKDGFWVIKGLSPLLQFEDGPYFDIVEKAPRPKPESDTTRIKSA